MPLFVGPALFDDAAQRGKQLALFSYTSTSVDLVNGNLLMADLSTSTYGLGKSSAVYGATANAYCQGFVDHAVDASEYKNYGSVRYRLIKVVVAGVKEDAVTDGSTTIGVYQIGSGTAGACTNGSADDEAYCIGVAMETDTSTAADVLVYPRWFV